MPPPRSGGRADRHVVARAIIWLAVATAVVNIVGFLGRRPAFAQGPPGMPPGPVKYAEAREQKVQRTVTLPGTVESRMTSTVASEVAGLVVELPVREGDQVRSGQTIAKLRTSSLDLRRQSLAGELKEAKARLDQAERQVERARELHATGVMSQSQYDEAESERTAAEGRVENLTAALAAIDLDLAHMTTRAPFSGAVVARRTEVGQWIEVGGPVFDLAAMGEIEVRVDVPEMLSPGAGSEIYRGLGSVVVGGLITSTIFTLFVVPAVFSLCLDARTALGVWMRARLRLPERSASVP